MRSSVEGPFSWIKGGFRRLAIRYERPISSFLDSFSELIPKLFKRHQLPTWLMEFWDKFSQNA